MTYLYACSLLAVLAGVLGSAYVQAEATPDSPLIHTHEAFSLAVAAPYDDAFPLFGAYEEGKWAAGFEPHFIFPSPATDQPGMVFTTTRDGQSLVWTNTAFDHASGRVQYVYFVNDTMVTLIDIYLARASATETRVDVVYERTALTAAANDLVTQQAEADRSRGKQWDQMINGYLRKTATK